MSPRLYELRVFRGDRQVRTANRLLCTLDLDAPTHVDDLLARHLYAAAERDGRQRRDAHLYHLEVHEVRGDYVDNRAKFQFSVPVAA